MNKTIYEINYDLLIKLGVFSESDNVPDYRKSKSDGFMDLVVERLPHLDESTGSKGLAFSLTHYFKQNGDLCKDPDVVVVIFPEIKSVTTYSFELSIPPVYQVVYPEPGKVRLTYKNNLNGFLSIWLNNLIEQGHGVNWEKL